MNTVRPIYALHGDIGKDVEVKSGSEGSLTEKSEHESKKGGESGLMEDEDVTDEGTEVKVAQVADLPTNEEIEALISNYINNKDLKYIQKSILIKKEYAGF